MMQQTSLLAYRELQDTPFFLSFSYQAILSTLRDNPAGMTDSEIARQLGYSDPNKVRPRRNELVKQGLVEEAGKKVCEVTGKLVIYWGVRR